MKIVNLFRELFKGNYDYFFHNITWRFPMRLVYYCRTVLILSQKPEFSAPKQTEYFARIATEKDCELLKQFGYTEQFILSRLSDGDKCSIVEKDNELLSCIWGTTHKRFQLYAGSIFDPGTDGFFLYSGYTRKDHRRKGLTRIARDFLYKEYSKEKRTRLYAITNKLNTSQLLFYKKCNSEIVGETLYVIFLGIHFCYYFKWPTATKKLDIFIKCPPENMKWV